MAQPNTDFFENLKKIYCDLVIKDRRKVTQINYDNETKKMTIDYDDGTSKVFNEIEVAADVATQERSDFKMAEVTYNFKDFMTLENKYVEDFGDDNE